MNSQEFHKLSDWENQLKKLTEQTDALLVKTETENRDLTEPEQREVERLMGKSVQLDRSMKDYMIEHNIAEAEVREAFRPGARVGARGLLTEDKVQLSSGSAKDKTFKGMFPNIALDNAGFSSFGEFLQAVDKGHDPRLEKKAFVGGTPSAGGFMVPTEYASSILDVSLENEIIRPRATVWPMKSTTLKVPAWDDLDHSSGKVYGGFEIAWLSEEEEATRQQGKLRQLELTAHKCGIYSQASREVIEDGISFEQQIAGVLTRGIGWGLDDAFINGDGAGKPLGLLNDPALVTVAKEDGQTEDTIVWANILNMVQSLHPSCLGRAIWIASQTTYAQLMSMYLPIGDFGTAVQAVTSRGGQLSLVERPLLFTEKCSVLGDVGDIILVDLSKYVIGMRSEVALEASNAPGWLTDHVDFRVIMRVDGQGQWSGPFKPKNGTDLSWVVTLAERAGT